MVQKVGEINLFFTTFINKTTMDSFGLFRSLISHICRENLARLPAKKGKWWGEAS